MELSSINTVLTQLQQFTIAVSEFITWQQCLLAIAAIFMLLLCKSVLGSINQPRERKKIYSVRQEPKIQMQQKVRVEELFKRIHNITEEGVKQEVDLQKPELPKKPRLNIHADSSYHHAIKLLRSGMDIQKLVEYCNLTMGEAELLAAMYSDPASDY